MRVDASTRFISNRPRLYDAILGTSYEKDQSIGSQREDSTGSGKPYPPQRIIKPVPVTVERSLSLSGTLLVGIYIGAELAANVTEAKPVRLFGLTVDGGTLIYALTFTLIDLIHERQGTKGAQKVILAAFAANVVLAAYVALTVWLPYPSFFDGQESYQRVLGQTPRIVSSSMAAFLLASLLDIEVYGWLKRKGMGYRWTRVLVSNAAGTLLDSVLFISLAFFGVFPLLPLILGNYAVKMGVTVLSLPLIYARGRSW